MNIKSGHSEKNHRTSTCNYASHTLFKLMANMAGYLVGIQIYLENFKARKKSNCRKQIKEIERIWDWSDITDFF